MKPKTEVKTKDEVFCPDTPQESKRRGSEAQQRVLASFQTLMENYQKSHQSFLCPMFILGGVHCEHVMKDDAIARPKGEFDMVILQKSVGLVIMEVKATGDKVPAGKNLEDIVVTMLRKTVKSERPLCPSSKRPTSTPPCQEECNGGGGGRGGGGGVEGGRGRGKGGDKNVGMTGRAAEDSAAEGAAGKGRKKIKTKEIAERKDEAGSGSVRAVADRKTREKGRDEQIDKEEGKEEAAEEADANKSSQACDKICFARTIVQRLGITVPVSYIFAFPNLSREDFEKAALKCEEFLEVTFLYYSTSTNVESYACMGRSFF
jgi:hypothetical protein